jgi:integrase
MDYVKEFGRFWVSGGRSKLTFDTYARLLHRYEDTGRELPPSLSDARDWVIELQDAGIKSASLLVNVRALKAFSKWYANEFGEVDLLAKMPFPKTDEPVPGRIAPDDDVERVLRYLKGRSDFRSLRDAAMITLFRDSGIRRAEMTRMKLEDVNLDDGVIVLPKTKGYQARIIPISNDARRALLRYLRVRSIHRGHALPELWLATAMIKPARPDTVTQMFVRRSADAKLSTPITAHQFRRRFALYWGERGGSDDALRAIAGWRDGRMVARYRAGQVNKLARTQFDKIINGAA